MNKPEEGQSFSLSYRIGTTVRQQATFDQEVDVAIACAKSTAKENFERNPNFFLDPEFLEQFCADTEAQLQAMHNYPFVFFWEMRADIGPVIHIDLFNAYPTVAFRHGLDVQH